MISLSPEACFGLVIVSILIIIWKSKNPSPQYLPLPPSPPGLPIVGNLFDVPTDDQEPSFRDLNLRYGEIVYLNACGQPMIVLGTHKAASDLLEKRSSNYSDRLFSCMSSLAGWTWLFSTLRYGSPWRRSRRLFHEYLNQNAVVRYTPIQEQHTHRYLLRMLETPEDFLHHGRHLFGAITIRVGYGIDVDKSDVDYLGIAHSAMAIFSLAFVPGKYLAESFPILRFLPTFFPGAQFKREAAEWYPIVRRMCDVPWQAALTAISEGRCMTSMATGLTERMAHLEGEAKAEEEESSKNAIASAYAGGADTTLSTLQNFYIAMASYPEVQRRAQAELDEVVGPHRLPTASDRADLPYINALIKEAFRWRPVVPLCLVHLSIEEDEYNGYRIPAGSAVVPNVWAYVRDPALYPDPETFKPERFLKGGKLDRSVQDPWEVVFGYGRRVCPGRHFADGSVFAAITAILHTMSISAPLDEQGNPINLLKTVKMTPGVISYPEPFQCTVKPRSEATAALIRNAVKDDEDADL